MMSQPAQPPTENQCRQILLPIACTSSESSGQLIPVISLMRNMVMVACAGWSSASSSPPHADTNSSVENKRKLYINSFFICSLLGFCSNFRAKISIFCETYKFFSKKEAAFAAPFKIFHERMITSGSSYDHSESQHPCSSCQPSGQRGCRREHSRQ